MTDIGVVAALPAEAATWPRTGPFTVAVSGVGAQRATDTARDLLARGVTALVSWGVAGGLVGALRPGDLVLADHVGSSASACTPDRAWRAQCAQVFEHAGIAVTRGSVWSHDRAVTAVVEKQQLARLGHAVVDMEAASVASVADAAGVPLLVLKAVCDPASRALPVYAPRLLRADGRVRVMTVALALARGPRTWNDLRQMHRDFDAARDSLTQAAAAWSLSCRP